MGNISSLSVVVASLLLAASSAADGTCDSRPGPVSVPIRNVTLPNQTVRRGIAMTLGSPPQDFAFTPVSRFNNTYVVDGSTPCDGHLPNWCITIRGGIFDEVKSSTWSSLLDTTLAAKTGLDTNVNLSAIQWGKDTLTLQPNIALPNFPLGVSARAPMQTTIGLGQNSTVVNLLYSAGKIASRTWSLWMGLQGSEKSTQMDGSLVFGGYDAAKTTGKNYTDRITVGAACNSGLVVYVTDIQMNFPNGTNHSIIGKSKGSAIKMCIQPDFPRITVPLDMWMDFNSTAGGKWLGRMNILRGYSENFLAEDVYPGDLTFSFSSGLQTTIPNSQLVAPVYIIDEQGATIFNDSKRDIMLAGLEAPNTNDMPILGSTFLSAAYLMVNQDDDTFTLWNSKATTDSSLFAVGGASSNSIPCSPKAVTPTTTTSRKAPAPSKKRMSAGAIAGITLGALFIVASIVFVLFWVHWRRTQAAAQNPEAQELPAPATGAILPFGFRKSRGTSMASSSASEKKLPPAPAPQELPSESPLVHELPAGGMGGTRTPELEGKRDKWRVT